MPDSTFDAAINIKRKNAETANAAADLAGEPTKPVPKAVPAPKGIKAKIAGAKKTLSPESESDEPTGTMPDTKARKIASRPKINIVDNVLKKLKISRDEE